MKEISLNFENVGFVSHPQITAAYIPLHPSSRSAQLLEAWLKRGEPFGDYLNIGALYLENDVLSCPPGYAPLKAGIYHLKVRQDLKLIAVDSTGNEFIVGYIARKYSVPLEEAIFPSSQIKIWPINLLLCLVEDVNIACIRYKECRHVEKSPGIHERECIEKEWCIGC